ncbi:DUF924 domain-containing protein [Aestuariirhabdus sp. Z084]|uniref:DUF924 family protein n=1 Tax=Aestuariirhabdus haliotis TaxID=2918751 RepID=UPI00201B39A9|nr:DUF924 family protein [Aestuariirhabdus haliotis]MCL6415564.1 DUF924 domain-containing protein [Aestuariirhabdus haliotis]MCL6419231.1 DUF924 domain-containing protein [Aestuariirhabdus haliotis]
MNLHPDVHPEVTRILSFWFAELEGQPETGKQLWWGKSAAVDRFVTEQFADLLAVLSKPGMPLLEDSPKGRLASIIACDQLPRHIYRDLGKAFAWDQQARNLVQEGLVRGDDRSLSVQERVFFYMPLMHSESLAEQEQGIALFDALADIADASQRDEVLSNARFARLHRDIIQRFGRFPHRNKALARQSSAEEIEFLTQPGSSF